MVVCGYCRLPKPNEVMSRAAKVAKTLKSSTPAKLYVYETIRERSSQDFEHMAPKFRQLIEEEHAMVGQRHFARQRHMAAADQSHIRDGVMGGAKGASCVGGCDGSN